VTRMKRGRWVHRLLVCALVGAGALAVGDASTPAEPVQAQAAGLGAGGEYHPVTPARIFDSRPPGINDVAPAGKKPTNRNGADFTVRVAGRGGLPADPADMLAVALNVTVVEPTTKGWLAVRPAGAPVADASLVNFEANSNVPNMTIVGVNGAGDVTVRLRTGATGRAHVLIDVFGWVSTSGYDGPTADDGARLVPYGPARLLDTRQQNRPLERRESRALQVLGARTFQPTSTIPNRSSIDAVLINLTGVNNARGSQNASTFLAAANERLTERTVTTSNTNLVRGEVKANLALVPLDANGRIHIYNHNGRTDVVVDIVAYFEVIDGDTTAGRIVPLDAPFRAFDTRGAAFGNVPLGFGSIEDWSFEEFAGSVTMPGSSLDLSEQSALIGNLTGTDLGRLYASQPVSTYLTAFPGGATRPASSNLNLTENRSVPNMALLRYGSDGGDDYVVQVYNHNGTTHYLFDVTAVVLK